MPAENGGLAETIRQMNRQGAPLPALGTVCPGDRPPVFVLESGRMRLKSMRWGMRVPGRSAPVINARSETAEEKPLFAAPVHSGRCLIPASLYFEWTRREQGAHTRMRVSGEGMLYMAGLYRPSGDTETAGEFAVLTRAAPGNILRLHDRMPMLLPEREMRRLWLEDEVYARLLLKNPPEVQCSIQADEPEQLSLFDMPEWQED